MQDVKLRSKNDYEIVIRMLNCNLDLSHEISGSKVWFALEHPKVYLFTFPYYIFLLDGFTLWVGYFRLIFFRVSAVLLEDKVKRYFTQKKRKNIFCTSHLQIHERHEHDCMIGSNLGFSP